VLQSCRATKPLKVLSFGHSTRGCGRQEFRRSRASPARPRNNCTELADGRRLTVPWAPIQSTAWGRRRSRSPIRPTTPRKK
jgi:hypothetical protein